MPKFRALMNNPKLVTDALNRDLEDWGTFQTGNTYTAQTFRLGNGKGFFIRVNIWKPPSKAPGSASGGRAELYYLIPHDHNFTFMTGGYLGSGYSTNIWEYDSAQLTGTRHQPVDLTFLERTSLSKGKIMIYRKSVNIHSQEHAEEFSVSLNLILLPEGSTADRSHQMIFNTEKGTVESILSASSGRSTVCDLAKYVGDSCTAGLLDSLSTGHVDAHVRAACLRSLLHLEPQEGEAIFKRAIDDADEKIHQIGRRGLETGFFPDSLYESITVDPHVAFETGPGMSGFRSA